jgi:hypothetical protein
MTEATAITDTDSAITDHSETRSPAEATAALNEKAAALARPVPLQPSNATEARMRLSALSSDSAFMKRFFGGEVSARAEISSLNAMIANAPVGEALAGGPEESPMEVTTSQNVRRADLLSIAADLRSLWAADSDDVEAVIREVLDPNATVDAELLQQAQTWKAQALRDPEFVRGLLAGDLEETKRMRLWNAIISIGTEG